MSDWVKRSRRAGSGIGLLLVLSACGSSRDAQSTTSIETVQLQHNEIWSKGNVELIPEIYAEHYVGHFPGGRTVKGRQGIRKTIEDFRAIFPDWTETVEQVIADGDRVVTLYRSTGTHTGEFLGIAGTGKRVEILEASVFRVVGRQIAEQWAFPDVLSLQNQTKSQ